jgi:hypothetical protein
MVYLKKGITLGVKTPTKKYNPINKTTKVNKISEKGKYKRI